uniref:Uncharacterized protein n=1 Tax=Anguilla anguilla TaxID=7936 RepID=A0A0E9QW13_ANGAN
MSVARYKLGVILIKNRNYKIAESAIFHSNKTIYVACWVACHTNKLVIRVVTVPWIDIEI